LSKRHGKRSVVGLYLARFLAFDSLSHIVHFFAAVLCAPPEHYLGISNPLADADKGIAFWFHSHLSRSFVSVLRIFSEFGAGESIALVLLCLALLFVLRRCWPALVTLIVAVPGGMLLNEWLKVLVHRHRPFVDGWFVDWSGYSFASGHTIGATLLYGQLALFIVPTIKNRRWRALVFAIAAFFVLLVGFSRIALGAHYLTDVLAAIFFGIVWLVFCLVAGKRLRRRLAPAPVVVSAAPEIGSMVLHSK
jgi:membrane-associated phospholipid phosphatase